VLRAAATNRAIALAAAEADEEANAAEDDSPEAVRDPYQDKLFRGRS
jgi:hypothetical protein